MVGEAAPELCLPAVLVKEKAENKGGCSRNCESSCAHRIFMDLYLEISGFFLLIEALLSQTRVDYNRHQY